MGTISDFTQWFNTYNNYGELTPAQLDRELDLWYEYAYRKAGRARVIIWRIRRGVQ